MKQFAILFIAILSSFITIGQTSERTWETDANALLAQPVIDKKCVGIAAGFSVANSTNWSAAKGVKNKDNQQPFTIETVTRLASITKPMTAIAILQLVEQSKIDLEASIQTYIPDFPIKKEGKITVKYLLQHASGVAAFQSKKENNNRKDYPNMAAAVDMIKVRDLIATPGEAFNYTSYGYTILGLVIENVSGMTYEEYLKKNIWDKAGMTQTSVEDCHQKYEGKATMYHRSSNGKVKPIKPTNLSDRIPGGGVQSTVADMLKFGDAILNETLVTVTSLELMWADSGLKKEGNGYGLGWYLYGENPIHGNVVGHSGGQLGCSAFFFILPKTKTSIIVVSNTSGILQEVSNIAVGLFPITERASE